jgi:excinuclease UvrABC nuclease subunit
MMATSMTSATRREMCVMCSPKQVVAITSCKGCLKDLCRKHFNEHRDTLSTDLHNVFDRHDNVLQELQLKINRESKSSDNNHARAILEQIDQWEKTTIKRVSQAANEARADVERLFDRKAGYD